jgi:hypothetical protein
LSKIVALDRFGSFVFAFVFLISNAMEIIFTKPMGTVLDVLDLLFKDNGSLAEVEEDDEDLL